MQSCCTACVDGSQSFFFFLLVFLFPWNHRRETEWIIGLRLFIKDLIIWVLSILFFFLYLIFLSLFLFFFLVFLSPFLYFTLFFFSFFHQVEHHHALRSYPTVRNFCRHTPYRIYHMHKQSTFYVLYRCAKVLCTLYTYLCVHWTDLNHWLFPFSFPHNRRRFIGNPWLCWRAPPVATIEVIWLMQSHMKVFKHKILMLAASIV